MPWDKNITNLDEKGIYRSFNAAAAENIFIGRYIGSYFRI